MLPSSTRLCSPGISVLAGWSQRGSATPLTVELERDVEGGRGDPGLEVGVVADASPGDVEAGERLLGDLGSERCIATEEAVPDVVSEGK